MKYRVLLASCSMTTLLMSFEMITQQGVHVVAQRVGDDTYTMHKLADAHRLAQQQLQEWEAFAATVDREQIRHDKVTFGRIDDDTYWEQLQIPLMKSAACASLCLQANRLTVTQCPQLAVDVLPCIIGDDGVRRVVIIERDDLGRRVYATVGGHVDHGETCEAAAARETYEEVYLKIDPASLRMIGVFSDPHRDPRGRHVVAIAYTCMLDAQQRPQASSEAVSVCLVTEDWVRSTKAEDWFAADHRDMVLQAFML